MTLVEFLAANAPWAWIVGGLILLALELVLPGGFLLWLGVAGLATGVAVLIHPFDWPLQWVMFGAVSLVAILLWLRWNRSRTDQSDRPYLNRRADRFIGHEAVLEQPIVGGYGRLALGDTIWRISGPNLPAGQRIRIIGSEGAILNVEAI